MTETESAKDMNLSLTLKKEWFDLIASGNKTFEYREYKPHWISRLLEDKSKRKSFKEVHFTNGYGKDKPFLRCEFIGMGIIKGKHCEPKNNEPIDDNKEYFVIALGDILEIRNV